MKVVLVDKDTITFPKVKKFQKSNNWLDLKKYDGPAKKRVKSKRTPVIPSLRLFKKGQPTVLKPIPRTPESESKSKTNVFPPLPTGRRFATINPPAFTPVTIDPGRARRELPENMRLGPPPPLLIDGPAMNNIPARLQNIPLNVLTLNM